MAPTLDASDSNQPSTDLHHQSSSIPTTESMGKHEHNNKGNLNNKKLQKQQQRQRQQQRQQQNNYDDGYNDVKFRKNRLKNQEWALHK